MGDELGIISKHIGLIDASSEYDLSDNLLTSVSSEATQEGTNNALSDHF